MNSTEKYKPYDELTDQEVFDMCANKSLEEIKAMSDEDYQAQAIRYYFSRLLMNYTEDEPLEDLDICVELEDSCGLSSLLMPNIIKMCQTPCEGYINVWIYGTDGWSDIDQFTTCEQLQILEDLLEYF